MSASVGVDRDVFAQWARWLDAGDVDAVRADLAALLADTEPGRRRPAEPEPDPAEIWEPEPGRDRPSYPAAPPISTR